MIFRMMKPNFNNLFHIEPTKAPDWGYDIVIYGYNIVTLWKCDW